LFRHCFRGVKDCARLSELDDSERLPLVPGRPEFDPLPIIEHVLARIARSDRGKWHPQVMYAVATFLVVAVLSMAFTQLAAGALIATGLPREVATFQARSAFSGAGFTTTETENVVNHPARRRIIGTTMFVGNLGTPTLVVTVLIGFLAPGPGNTAERTMVTVAGLVLIIMTIANRPAQRALARVGQRAARKRLLPHLDDHVVELYAVDDDFIIGAVTVANDPEPTVRSLRAMDEVLPLVKVLAVRHGDSFLGAPPVDVHLDAGDEIILYGRRADIDRIHAPMN